MTPYSYRQDMVPRRQKKGGPRLSFFIIVLSLAGIFYILLLSPFLKVEQIEYKLHIDNVERSEPPDQKTLDAVDQLVSGRVWFLFSRRHSLLFPRKELAAILKNNRVYKDIRVKCQSVHLCSVAYALSSPAFTLMQEQRNTVSIVTKDEEKNNDTIRAMAVSPQTVTQVVRQYFTVSQDGVILQRIQDTKDQPALVVYKTNKALEPGEQILGDNQYASLIQWKNLFETHMNAQVAYVIMSDEYLKTEFHLVTQAGWELYFDISSSVGEAMQELDALKMKNKITKHLEYIDMRIPGRAYIKY